MEFRLQNLSEVNNSCWGRGGAIAIIRPERQNT